MEELGANAIRVYHVDADGDHDGCMKAFADAGIYVLLDLDTFNTYILPEDLYWNTTQYDKYSQVMDTFQGYDNTLGFFVGNENIAKKDSSVAAPYLKAAARDLKAYRDSKGYRKIPVGYSAADIQELRPMLQDYLTCGGNSSENVDFFALNSYSWCDPSDYKASTYNKLQDYAVDFPVPIFFSETGCIIPGPRLWDDQDAIFSAPMVNDWSGAIVYEWIQEENNYGIISYGKAGADAYSRSGTPTPVSPDFANLKTKWASNNPTGVSKSDYNPKDVSTRACPTSTNGGWWAVDGNVALPSLGETFTDGSFTSQASATADPTDAETTDSSGNGGDEDSAYSDKKITTVGAVAAGIVLAFCVWL